MKFTDFWRQLTIPQMHRLQQWQIELIQVIAKQAYTAGFKEGKKQNEQ